MYIKDTIILKRNIFLNVNVNSKFGIDWDFCQKNCDFL